MNAVVADPTPLAGVGDRDRRTYIGGSDIAAILGIDPYNKTPLTVYQAKRGELEGRMDPEKVRFLARRKRWEGPIVEMLREEFDGQIVAVNQRYVDPEHDFLAAEIDFEWVDGDGNVQNGEIKTVSPFAFNERSGWGEAGTADVPVHYHAQVMHGLGVKRRQRCIVAAMAGLDTMAFYRIERDDETIAGMREVAMRFWNDNVLAGVPPEPISMADVGRLFNKRRGRPVDLDQETSEVFERLRQVRGEIAALEGDQAEFELAIAKFICAQWGLAEPTLGKDGAVVAPEMKENSALMFGGQVLGTWNGGRGSHLDQKRLAAEHPEIKAEYTVPHFYRTFRFAKKS